MINSIDEIKNVIDGINSRLWKAEEYISELEHRVMGSNKVEEVRDKYCIMRTDLENSAPPLSIIAFTL